jgi:hypothetical protein
MDSSSKRKRIKPCRGDLFEFAAGDGRYGYGLIVIPGDVFYAIFFRSLHALRPDAASLIADEIALGGATTDSHFYNGQWTIIARDQSIPAKSRFRTGRYIWEARLGLSTLKVLIVGRCELTRLVFWTFNSADRQLVTKKPLRR